MSSLGQLVAGIAHEINNPVGFIHGNLFHAQDYVQSLIEVIRLYQKSYPSPTPDIQKLTKTIELDFLIEDLPQLFDSMEMGSERICQIVQSLRNFSRMDEAEVKYVDLHEGLESTLMLLQHRLKPYANRPMIQIIRCYGDLPKVECYAGQLNQVFMNILTNAIDAIDEMTIDQAEQSHLKQSHLKQSHLKQSHLKQSHLKQSHSGQSTSAYSGWIKIRTEVKDHQWVEIAIADNGPGISQAVKQRIFDPFFTTKPVGKGTGMGMSISYQIVTQKHQGKLECISQPNQGTEFIIQIPIQQIPTQQN